MRNCLAILSLLITGCATTSEPIPIHYQFTDNPAERRVELTYQNSSKHTMCLLPEQWPNLGGKINQASDIVHLIVDHERFPVKDFNTGYCLGACAVKVFPNEKTATFIRYEDFELPDRLINEPKTLDFAPVAFRCSSWR